MNQIVKEEFAAKQTQLVAETASVALAAQAKAAVEARYVMAMQRPRDWDNVRSKLMRECHRTNFADSAIYHKPIGKGITGLSIRFVECALRCMSNTLTEVAAIYDDNEKRIVKVTVTDLESNTTFHKDIVIPKTVERKFLKEGQEPISKRTNSYGETTYTVEASEDDFLNKQGALESKAVRNCGLRLIPGDLQDEAMSELQATRQQEAFNDPDAARKKMVDAFASINVGVPALKGYLGCDLDGISPEQINEMRAIFTTIKSGEATWSSYVKEEAKTPAKDASKEVVNALKDQISATTDLNELKKLAPEIDKLGPNQVDAVFMMWAGKKDELEANDGAK